MSSSNRPPETINTSRVKREVIDDEAISEARSSSSQQSIKRGYGYQKENQVQAQQRSSESNRSPARSSSSQESIKRGYGYQNENQGRMQQNASSASSSGSQCNEDLKGRYGYKGRSRQGTDSSSSSTNTKPVVPGYTTNEHHGGRQRQGADSSSSSTNTKPYDRDQKNGPTTVSTLFPSCAPSEQPPQASGSGSGRVKEEPATQGYPEEQRNGAGRGNRGTFPNELRNDLPPIQPQPRFTTFISRNTPTPEEERLRMQQKGLEIKKRREMEAREKQKAQQWKKNRAAPKTSNFDDTDDDDGDVVARAIESSDDEIVANEVVIPEALNAAKISRFLSPEKVKLVQQGAVASGGKDSDSDDDDKKKKKKKDRKKDEKKDKRRDDDSDRDDRRRRKRRRSSSSSSRSSDEEERRRRKKRKRRSSSSNSEDDKRSQKKKSKSSKKRRRRASSESSSSSSSEEDGRDRRRRKEEEKEKEKMKAIERVLAAVKDPLARKKMREKLVGRPQNKWTFLDWRTYEADKNNLVNFVVTGARDYDGELFQHDHIHNSELPIYRIHTRCILHSTAIEEWKEKAMNVMFYPFDDKDKKKVKKPLRLGDQLKWSKDPEKFFLSKAVKKGYPLPSFMALSKERIDPGDPGWMEYEQERRRKLEPEVYEEKERYSTGERTTEVFLKELELDKLGSLEEKRKKLEVAINNDPKNVDLWLKKLELQDAIFQRQCLQAIEDHSPQPAESVNLEIKLEIIKKARSKLANSFALFAKKVEYEKGRRDPQEILRSYANNKAVFNANPRYWQSWMDLLLNDIKYYKTKDVEYCFDEALRITEGILGGTIHAPNVNLESLKCANHDFLYRKMHWMVNTGRYSAVIAYMQASLEFLTMPLRVVELYTRGGVNKFIEIDKHMKAYWDSGMPRIGDKETIFWKGFDEAKLEGTLKVPPEIELEEERKAMAEEEKALVAQWPSTFSVWGLWVQLERIREGYAFRPIRMDKDLECDELERFHDFSSLHLHRISPEKIRDVALHCIQLLGARLPFQVLDETAHTMQAFGGFPVMQRLPERIGEILSRLLSNLIEILEENGNIFHAARVMTAVDAFSRSRNKQHTARHCAMNILGISDAKKCPKARLAALGAQVLALLEATRWVSASVGKGKDGVDWTMFKKYAALVMRLTKSENEQEATLVEKTEPYEFALLASVLLALVMVAPNPTEIVKVMMYGIGPYKDFLAWLNKKEEKEAAVPAAPVVIQTIQTWTEIATRVQEQRYMNELQDVGLYSPHVLANVLRMQLVYAAGKGESAERVSLSTLLVPSVWSPPPCVPPPPLPSSDPHSLLISHCVGMDTLNVNSAFLFRNVVQLVQKHNKQYHNCTNQLRQLLSVGRSLCPNDVWLLREYLETQLTTVLKRIKCAEWLREEHKKAASSGNTPIRRLFSVARLFFARRTFEVITMAHEDQQNVVGIINKLTKEYEMVAESENDPLYWRLLIRLRKERKDSKGAFQAYVRACSQCVWSRALHLDAAEAYPENAKEVMKLMVEKDIPLFADEEQAELLLLSKEQSQ